ncbi:Elongation factor Tu GTP binding domain [Rhizoctonia solani]|uniref:Elongation factor Tu GTP binding domain n=1 Tax=Rhizoctonia solani TaxID=456999 RepID=A0A8H7IAY1_9AGAM|nr:Elongation factor Tu GTP binding domain [Rhizoctonia solani]
MTTTLRGFQHEIEQIHDRELAKQRAEGPNHSGTAGRATEQLDSDDDDSHNKLQKMLTEPEVDQKVTDYLALLLLRNRGEIIVRLGTHPPLQMIMEPEELDIALKALEVTADSVGAKTMLLYRQSGAATHTPYASLLVRLPPPTVERTLEVRCAVVGNVDSGKSTTLGVLTRGGLDDGRGKARVALFRHKHEIETGRTSSVGMEASTVIHFRNNPNFQLNTAEAQSGADKNAFAPATARREKLTWDQISESSAKIVSFIDLAGHERYLKTTLYGMTSHAPDCVMLMVGANAGLIGMSKEHLAIALALSVPVIVTITKIDMTPANVLQDTIKQVVKILKSPGCRKTPVFVKSMEQAVELSRAFATEKLCPIFLLSNVTGEGLDHLRMFLNLVPSSEGDEHKFTTESPLEVYSVIPTYSLYLASLVLHYRCMVRPYVGVVVNGIINAGAINTGDAVLLGPDGNGQWIASSIKSIQRKRANVESADAGQTVSIALKRVRRANVRKGMVLVARTDHPPHAARRFQGQVLILYHNTTMQIGYQAMLHCGAIRQTVRIIGIKDHAQGVLRTGDRATVEFEFISTPEYIKEGMKLLFREGKTKGLGVITKVL